MSISAKFWRARIGSTVVSGATRFSVDEKGDRLDATTAESDGYGDTDIGVQECEISLNGVHELAASPWPGLGVGTELTDLRIYLRASNPATLNGPYHEFPLVVVTGGVSSGETRGRLEWSANVATKGPYTLATNG